MSLKFKMFVMRSSFHARFRLTCIYAACKAEENHVSAEELGKGIEQDHQMILNNEMLVLQSLGFELIVYAPYQALEGFINDVEELCDGKMGLSDTIKNLHESAKGEVDKIMWTEAPLLFRPGQLALAALHKSCEFRKVIDLERYLKSMLCRQHPACAVSDFNLTLNAIDTLINILETPTSKDVKHIHRKLKSCLDPTSHENRREREQQERGQKESRKHPFFRSCELQSGKSSYRCCKYCPIDVKFYWSKKQKHRSKESSSNM